MEVDAQLIGLILCAVGIMVEHFHFQASLQERISKLETKIDLFWGALEDKIPEMLMKGNPIEKGSDLYKMLECKLNGGLTKEGKTKLIDLLYDEINKKKHSPQEETVMLLMATALKARMVE
jgi:hypothetical protein